MKKYDKFPSWIRVKISCGPNREKVGKILEKYKLNTVCQSARCPNLGECWHTGTATFMIMGNECTRNCKFCAIKHNPSPKRLNPEEPKNIANAAVELNLRYVVVTSVTRDDLPDGGASHFAEVIKSIHKINLSSQSLSGKGDIKIEVLTPDFHGKRENIRKVIRTEPTVFNHNVETVERLSGLIRNKANYKCSLQVLSIARELSHDKIPIKSGLMVGLGEKDKEVEQTIKDIYNAGARLLTIGQYLRPSPENIEVARFVEPQRFDYWKQYAEELGFAFVASAPLVRSSYSAEEAYRKFVSQSFT